MKYRVMSGCVTVIGRPCAACCSNAFNTDPFDPNTLPKRTDTHSVGPSAAKWAVSRSVIRFVHPSTLVGFAALSVLMFTRRVPCRGAAPPAGR